MIQGVFDRPTLAKMEVALERVCANTPLGEQHDVRKWIAKAIVQRVKAETPPWARWPKQASAPWLVSPSKPCSPPSAGPIPGVCVVRADRGKNYTRFSTWPESSISGSGGQASNGRVGLFFRRIGRRRGKSRQYAVQSMN